MAIHAEGEANEPPRRFALVFANLAAEVGAKGDARFGQAIADDDTPGTIQELVPVLGIVVGAGAQILDINAEHPRGDGPTGAFGPQLGGAFEEVGRRFRRDGADHDRFLPVKWKCVH